MKVRVVKCSNNKWWYNNRIGETFDIDRLVYGYNAYEIDNPDITKGEDRGLLVDDCEVIPEEQPQFNIGDTVEIVHGKQGKIVAVQNDWYTARIGNELYELYTGKSNCFKLIKRSSTDTPPVATIVPAEVHLKLSGEQAGLLRMLIGRMGKQQIAYVLNEPLQFVVDNYHKLANDIYCELGEVLE